MKEATAKAVRTMSQDLIGSRNHRKLKALFPCVAVALKKLRERSAEGFCCLFIDLRSCGRKLCLNKCHGYSENSDGCPYRLRIC